MPLSILCPKCGVVLNLPEGVEGRRLRCPKCNERFQLGAVSVPAPKPATPPGEVSSRRPTSSLMLTESNEAEMPRAERDLRETFSPELLLGEEEAAGPAGRVGPARSAAGPAGGVPAIADAAALFADDPAPVRKPRTNLAEARSRPRRCPSCGGVVPIGMSLCSRCGLDLDTGQRPLLDEVFESAPPPRRKETVPIPVLVVGGGVLLASAVLTILALVQSMRPAGDEEAGLLNRQNGFLSLALVGAFCIYAAIQFLRGRNPKLMVVALLLGAVVDLIGLIALPVYDAMNAPPVPAVVPIGPQGEEAPPIRNVADQLDSRKLSWGIAILLTIAAALVAQLSPSIRNYFERKPAVAPVALT